MTRLFKWCPLQPPSLYPKSLTSVANRFALAAALTAAGMMLFGLEQGFGLYLPLILSVFLFGLPHGAIDHLVMIGLARRQMRLTALAGACLIYLIPVVLFLILWFLSPLAGLVLFLGITIYHWGKADLAFESILRPATQQAPRVPRFLSFSHLLLRGFLPIGTPFLAFPGATEAFITACTSSFGYDFTLPGAVRLGLLLCLSALLLSEYFYLKTCGPQRRQLLAEDAGLLIFFILVPPLLAIGLYFCLWHGLRHVLRLIHYRSTPDETEPEQLVEGLKRFYIRALPFTLASLLILLVVLLFLPEVSRGEQLIGLYLVVISSLTLPHLIVVEWMDARERI